MIIAVSGSSGLIGGALTLLLQTHGHCVKRLVRQANPPDGSTIYWEPTTGKIDDALVEGLDAVVHLAGETIAQRWTTAAQSRILLSRTQPTRVLATVLSHLQKPPKVFISASAIGFYGNRGDERLHEESAPGTGFLAEVCREWETATEPAQNAGIRVVNLRLGLVLSEKGGALAKMLLPFRLGLGGAIGSGAQWWSWVALDDVVGAIMHCLVTKTLRGPVNCVAPNPVTNREFTKTLGRVLKRPAILPLPAFVARAVLGEMADELLLSSARVEPKRLMGTQYPFWFRDLEPALRCLLSA